MIKATKMWEGEWAEVLERHPDFDLYVGNNLEPPTVRKLRKLLGDRFVDLGPTGHPYYIPERAAADMSLDEDYIVWFAGDVIEPTEDWLKEALPLLEEYPFVSPRLWGENIDERDHNGTLDITPWGWTSYYFSDQAWVTKGNTLKKVDYDIKHRIAKGYPVHGGNSFERRVAQWLASTKQPVAWLKKFRAWHIDKREKHG